MSRGRSRRSLIGVLLAAALIIAGCAVPTTDSVTDGALGGDEDKPVVDNTAPIRGPGIYFESTEISPDPARHGEVTTRRINENGTVGDLASQDNRSPFASQVNLPFPRNAHYGAARWFNEKTGGSTHQIYNGANSSNNATIEAPEYIYGAACGTLHVLSQAIPNTCIAVGYYVTTTYWYIGGPGWTRTAGIDIKERLQRESPHYGICNGDVCLNYANSGPNSGGFEVTATTCSDKDALGCLFPQLNLDVARKVEKACAGISGCIVVGGGLQGKASISSGVLAAEQPKGFQIIKPAPGGELLARVSGSGWDYNAKLESGQIQDAVSNQSCWLDQAPPKPNCLASTYLTGVPEAQLDWWTKHTNVAWIDLLLELASPWLAAPGGGKEGSLIEGHLLGDQIVAYMNSFYTVGHTIYTVLYSPKNPDTKKCTKDQVKPGADFTSCPKDSLRGASLSNADGSNIKLAGLDLTGTNFTGANLSGANMAGTNVTGTNFGQANLKGAELRNATFDKTKLADAELADALVTGAYSLGGIVGTPKSLPKWTVIRNGYLIGPQITLKSAKLANADLSSVDLSGANLTGADLSGANLTSADLSRAVLKGANVSGATWTDGKKCGADSTDGVCKPS